MMTCAPGAASDTVSEAAPPYIASSRARRFPSPVPSLYRVPNPSPSSSTASTRRSPFRRAEILIVPPSRRGPRPCFNAFSTRGCSEKDGTEAPANPSPMLYINRQPRAETLAFHGEVSAHECEFAFQAASHLLRSFEGRPKHFREILDGAFGCVRIRPRQRRDRVQRIEQEVRIHLRLQRGEPRCRQLRLHSTCAGRLLLRVGVRRAEASLTTVSAAAMAIAYTTATTRMMVEEPSQTRVNRSTRADDNRIDAVVPTIGSAIRISSDRRSVRIRRRTFSRAPQNVGETQGQEPRRPKNHAGELGKATDPVGIAAVPDLQQEDTCVGDQHVANAAACLRRQVSQRGRQDVDDLGVRSVVRPFIGRTLSSDAGRIGGEQDQRSKPADERRADEQPERIE